jgi:hypothetical protein
MAIPHYQQQGMCFWVEPLNSSWLQMCICFIGKGYVKSGKATQQKGSMMQQDATSSMMLHLSIDNSYDVEQNIN